MTSESSEDTQKIFILFAILSGFGAQMRLHFHEKRKHLNLLYQNVTRSFFWNL